MRKMGNTDGMRSGWRGETGRQKGKRVRGSDEKGVRGPVRGGWSERMKSRRAWRNERKDKSRVREVMW